MHSHAHKATVMSVQWNRNGNWLLTASRDHLIKVYDIRAMKEMYTLKGHKKDVNSKGTDPGAWKHQDYVASLCVCVCKPHNTCSRIVYNCYV